MSYEEARNRARARGRVSVPLAVDQLDLALEGSAYQDSYHELVRERPNVRKLAERMSGYLSNEIPSDDGQSTLLRQCLEEGLQRWQSASHYPYRSADRYVEYLRGLFTHVHHLREWGVKVVDHDTLRYWDPVQGPLLPWWRRYPGKLTVARRERPWDPTGMHLSDTDMQTLLTVRLLERVDLVNVAGGFTALIER
ncbi:MAG: hypothetical protein AMS22_11440 [Thiotrichales bacterium SG8_50]|nr:MAG: hypothetical protein AMS22_11440 [Thiotrichales bacterium SG8_50]